MTEKEEISLVQLYKAIEDIGKEGTLQYQRAKYRSTSAFAVAYMLLGTGILVGILSDSYQIAISSGIIKDGMIAFIRSFILLSRAQKIVIKKVK